MGHCNGDLIVSKFFNNRNRNITNGRLGDTLPMVHWQWIISDGHYSVKCHSIYSVL